jgi:methylphosphotriester-DNA--protein-cysteine methyltransferase
MLASFNKTIIKNPLWLSVSEAAKLGGVKDKTIRRALKAESGLKFKVIKNRYQIELGSLIAYLHKNTKLLNKLMDAGLGQYWPNTLKKE